MVVWSKGIIYIYIILSLSLSIWLPIYIYIYYIYGNHTRRNIFSNIFHLDLKCQSFKTPKTSKNNDGFWMTHPRSLSNEGFPKITPPSWILCFVAGQRLGSLGNLYVNCSVEQYNKLYEIFLFLRVFGANSHLTTPLNQKKTSRKHVFFLVVRSCMKRYKKLPNLEEKQPFFWGKNTTSMASRDTKLQLGSVRSIWHNSFRKRHSHTRQASWRGELVDMASFQSIQQSHLKMLSHPNLVGGFNALILCHVSVKHLHLSSLKVSYILHHHSKPWYCWWLKSC